MDDFSSRSGLLRKLTDPVNVRRPAEVAGLVLSVASGIGFAALEGGAQALVLGACWLAMVPAALLYGWGLSFFIEHGRGLRRAILELIGGGLMALVSCGVLAYAGGGGALETIIGLVSGTLLYLAIFRTLGSGVGLGLGRGAGYLGHRIQQMDDEGW